MKVQLRKAPDGTTWEKRIPESTVPERREWQPLSDYFGSVNAYAALVRGSGDSVEWVTGEPS